MKYTEELANEICKKFNVSLITKRIWKFRGKIPDRYAFSENEFVTLWDVLPEKEIIARIEKFGEELENLISSRTFYAGNTHGYYMKCLYSLCKEVKK